MIATLNSISAQFFDVVSLLLTAGALIYAALAFRVGKQSLEAAKTSDVSTLKLKAFEARGRAEQSSVDLQEVCHDARKQWKLHHERHYPKLGGENFRKEEIRHISEIENSARTLIQPLTLSLSELGSMEPAALEQYLQQAHQAVTMIDQLRFQVGTPKPLLS